jgi:hypothetical protein
MQINKTINKIKERMTLKSEEYVSSVESMFKRGSSADTYFPIFKNPDKSEIKELKKFGVHVRFAIYKKDVFVFPAELLHVNALRELSSEIGLPRDLYSTNDPKVAFFGIAKINLGSLKLTVTDTNQRLTPEDLQWIEKNYTFMDRYFD